MAFQSFREFFTGNRFHVLQISGNPKDTRSEYPKPRFTPSVSPRGRRLDGNFQYTIAYNDLRSRDVNG